MTPKEHLINLLRIFRLQPLENPITRIPETPKEYRLKNILAAYDFAFFGMTLCLIVLVILLSNSMNTPIPQYDWVVSVNARDCFMNTNYSINELQITVNGTSNTVVDRFRASIPEKIKSCKNVSLNITAKNGFLS